MATVTLRPFGDYAGTTVETVALIALLVCLIPTTIGGLLSAIGIAGMDRVARFNVLAMSGRAVEASGDVDVILLDKTGTITYGNRLAASITPAPGVDEAEALRAALVSSIRDETPEGRSVVDLARKRLAELGSAGAAPATTPASRRSPRPSPRRSRSRPRRAPAASGRRTGPSCSRARSTRSSRTSMARWPPELVAEADRIADAGATPLAIRERRPSRRHDRAQGHRQGGARRALRRVPQDGHPHGHDHRRQPADRGHDREGGRRRRLHRRRPRPRRRSPSSASSRPTATSSP